MFEKATPVLIVDAIEPILPFWTALGFTRVTEVPEGDRLGFVILQRGEVEIMYQTFASVEKDEPRSLKGKRPIGAAAVFIVVDKLDDVSKLVPSGTDVIEQRRETFYGSREMIVRDAAGNVITFAEMKTT
jgi:uncharacterized glyoxalase superfamily protein PhnB